MFTMFLSCVQLIDCHLCGTNQLPPVTGQKPGFAFIRLWASLTYIILEVVHLESAMVEPDRLYQWEATKMNGTLTPKLWNDNIQNLAIIYVTHYFINPL